MNLLGIIAEYNPFHNGHKYHLDKSKDAFKPDATVVVLSGNFTQRGMIACFDKWTRTKCALLSGADLVIELPVTFATASAERFAYGSIFLLNSMNVKYLSFGAEDSLEELNIIADKLLDQNFRIEKNSPVPFHIARQSYLGDDMISKPNNILGIEYLKALKTLNSDIVPYAIKRFGAGYNDLNIINNTASATKVRNMIANSENYSDVIPANLAEIYENSRFVCQDDLFKELIYSIRSKALSDIKEYAHIREGIESRIYKSAFEATSFDDLVKRVKSKRYTYTSVSRMLTSIFLGIKKDDLAATPEYIRVLGLNDKGSKALNYIKTHTNLPIITKVSSASDILPTDAQKCFEFDIKSGDLYYSISNITTCGRPDFIKSPIKI